MCRLLLGLFLALGLALSAQPLTVAHRGGPVLGPENALATFQRALELNVDAIELDIHQSRDGDLMVIHDATLRRTYGIDGVVNQMSTQELLAAGVPTLQHAIDLVAGRCRLFIEIKQPHQERYVGIEERVLQHLLDNGLLGSAVVISFDADTLRRLHQLDARVTTGWLTGTAAKARLVEPDLGVTYLSPHYRDVDAEFIRWAHSSGYKVSVWTVDEPEAMERLLQAGCDAITTNHPQRLLDELRETSKLYP